MSARWPVRLAAIRQQAALNCGFTEYPAELVAAFEAIDVSGYAWRMVSPERRIERHARYAAAWAEALRQHKAGGSPRRRPPASG